MRRHRAQRNPVPFIVRRSSLIVLFLLAAAGARGQEPLQLPKPAPAEGGPASNLVIVASRHLLNAAMSRPNERTEPVYDEFEGTISTGEAHSQSVLTVELLPSEERAVLNLVVNGTVHTLTTGRNPRLPIITLHNQGVTVFEARKPVFIEESGVTWLPTKVCARARIELLCVETSLKHQAADQLLRQLARQQFYQTKPRAERHQVERAEESISSRTDEETEQQLPKLNEQLEEQKANLHKNGLEWSSLTFKTTPLALRAAFVADEGPKAAAHGPLPEAPWPADLSVRVHQNVVNEAGRKRYGGKTRTAEQLREELGGVFRRQGEKPAEPEKKDEQPAVQPFEVTFTENDPLVLEAAEDVLTLTLNTSEFATLNDAGEKTGRYFNIRIIVRYKVQMTPSGPTLKRDGDPDAKSPTGALDAAAAVAVKRRIRPLFPEEVTIPPITPTGNMARVGKLRPTTAKAEAGWLTLGYER